MYTLRSFLVLFVTLFLSHSLVEALPQDPAVVTSVQVVTVFAGGQGEGDGAVQSTVAATDGVNAAAGGYVVPFVAATGGLVQAATVGDTPAVITQAPVPVSTVGPVNPDCAAQCSLYFQYVNAYYWPTPNTNNTACLSGVTAQANAPIPTDLVPQSPSNYLVFPTISAGNACTRVGNIYYDQTIAFAPGALSTIVGNTGVTQEFNFADLPCPPPDVAAANSYFYNPSWNPGRPYSPLIAPPQEIFNLDPAFAGCVAAVYQGFDPPGAFPTAPGVGGPGRPGPHKRRGGPGHNVPHGPVQTAAPWS